MTSRERIERSGLARAVSRWEVLGLSINDVVGSGVYLLPAAAAALLGAVSIWAVVLSGLAVGLLVLCFAEASSYFDEPGGGYVYAREAFGRFVGFEVGWMTWLARVASVASLLNGFVLATAYLWPEVASGWGRALLMAFSIGALALINVLGVREGARTAVTLVALKLLPLLFFVLVGIFFVEWPRVLEWTAPGPGALGEAALLLLFAYAGFENTPAAAGEYRNPQRDVPFALLTMILFLILLYTLVQLVSVGTLPGLAQVEAPLAEAAGSFAGSWAALLLTAGAVVSILGNISNTTLIGPRYLFALARDGFGPRKLAEVHERFRTPAVAIVTQAAISLALALSGTFVQLAMLSVVARLTTYVGTAAAVPVLRRRFGRSEKGFVLPGGSIIPAAAIMITIAFAASARVENLIAGGVALVIGAAVYRHRRNDEEPPTRT